VASIIATWPLSITDRGYRRRRTPDGPWVYEHILVARQWADDHDYQLPDKWSVRWLDGDHTNNDESNLLIIDTAGRALTRLRQPRGPRAPRIEVPLPGGLGPALAGEARRHGVTPARYATILLAAMLATDPPPPDDLLAVSPVEAGRAAGGPAPWRRENGHC